MATQKAGEQTKVEADWADIELTPQEDDSPEQPVPPNSVWTALSYGAIAAVLVAVAWVAFAVVVQSSPFQVDPDNGGLRVRGISAVRPDEIRHVFAEDFGGSLASVDILGRMLDLRAIPWVRTAVVSKVWPRTISVTIVEREPVAYLRLPESNAIRMIDTQGVILDVRQAGEGSLPVLTGIDEEMLMAERQLRVRLFSAVMAVFAAKGATLAEAVSEIDVSDSGNAVVLARHENRMIKLQMGDRHLEHRLDMFLNYIDAWSSEFGPVEAVDLRFEKQVAVRPLNDARRRS